MVFFCLYDHSTERGTVHLTNRGYVKWTVVTSDELWLRQIGRDYV